MSRFYDIALSPTIQSGIGVGSLVPNLTTGWSSYSNGTNDPGALNVEFDFLTFDSAGYSGFSTLTIHGISLSDLQQAPLYTGMNIAVQGGMKKGLPLASPEQAGMILQGQIFQSFGNWVGTEMTIDFVINYTNATYFYNQPGNITFTWLKGTPLADALKALFKTAYPNVQSSILIGNEYVLNHDEHHVVSTLPEFSTYLNSITKAVKAPGVNITVLPTNVILAYDGSVPFGGPKQINFTDLVGQPTWVNINLMQFTTVMRGDIQVNNVVTMPQGLQSVPGQVTTVPIVGSQPLKNQVSFRGPFLVQSIRHVGNFRDPNGASWVSIFQCYPSTPNA